MKQIKKSELEEKVKELERQLTWNREAKYRYNNLQNILLERLNLPINEKLELILKLYKHIKISKVANKFVFEYPDANAYVSFQEDTIEAGINKLLNYQVTTS